jgi:eukaryotic-like serine/threonine-protein kinase
MESDFPGRGVLIGGVYRVGGPLGAGGMGVVVEALDETLNRKVAIKFIRPSMMDDNLRARFQAEAQAMARVTHPNILQIHAFGEHEGAPYFVMQHIEGLTLDAWVIKHGLPEPGLALEFLEQICAGVAAIHAADTVHRDLKPSNVLIDSRGRAHVADLGLALLRGEETSTRHVVGTPSYMAPEVALLSSRYPDACGKRADVYSLGCIAYELLTGSLPFVATNNMAMMYHHATVPPEPPSERRAALPKLLDEIVLRALAKDPADRIPSAEALGAAFRAAREGVTEPTRILVAEDHEDFRELLKLGVTLAFPGAAVDCVANGREALESFDRDRPSVAILDLNMPELDGLELTALLRARDPNAVVPIIVLTASGGPADWKRLMAVGADRFLVKPVVIDDVVAMVRHLLKQRWTSSRPPSLQPSSAPPPA